LESPYAKLDIIKRILESTQNSGSQDHRLMYGSYLTYMQIDEYLTAMVATGLVRHARESGTYRITAKGMDFLASLRQMDYLIRSIDR
jgi:predicted transcriptional regulator